MTDDGAGAWETIPVERRDRTVILFSAHGLPQKFIDEGDPYVAHIQAHPVGDPGAARPAQPAIARLPVTHRPGEVARSRHRGDDRGTGREGVKDLLVVPLSFVSDHIETLYEVDHALRGGRAGAPASPAITGPRR